ncbi:MAG: glycosyltransferase family 2 protein [Planctomycetales bacterium]|nr:glycosyltransferase family 2 protein [Planctomycetales bacterium]
MLLSIVIPVYNEEQSLDELLTRINEVAEREQYQTSVLLVDDGSSDRSWSVIERLSQQSAHVRGLKLRRNFGKAAALAAAFERVEGDYVITMDADLQDDPREIPHLLAKLSEGYDVVSGWKQVRHDPWHKVLPSRLFNGMISWLTGVRLHDHNCGLKAYRREVLDEVHLYGEMHRFVPVLAASKGFRVAEIVIQHHPRKHGVSKYGVERFVKGFLDLLTVYFLTGYGNRPQHLLGTIGLGSFAAGFLGLLVLSGLWVVSRMTSMDDVHLHSKAIFYYCIVALLLGVQLITMGFLAELITAQNRPSRQPYSIAKDTQSPPPDNDPANDLA